MNVTPASDKHFFDEGNPKSAGASSFRPAPNRSGKRQAERFTEIKDFRIEFQGVCVVFRTRQFPECLLLSDMERG
jgi:hypothetical protein